MDGPESKRRLVRFAVPNSEPERTNEGKLDNDDDSNSEDSPGEENRDPLGSPTRENGGSAEENIEDGESPHEDAGGDGDRDNPRELIELSDKEDPGESAVE